MYYALVLLALGANSIHVVDDCNVVIAGGSVAAFAAALASASENVTTCLLEVSGVL